jgi:hypothetical protein
VSTLCLFVLLGGSAVAAVQLSKNSVRSRHIKNGEVRTADLRAGAVNSRKVKDGSLLSQDFAAGQLTPGPKGDKGDPGAPGERGPQGEAGPGAVKLVFDVPATGAADPEPFATVGPFQFAVVCDLVGGEDVIFSLRVRGGTAAEYQLAAVDAPNDTGHMQRTGGGAISSVDYTNLWNTGAIATGNFRRIAGTIQLKSGESVWTVTMNMLGDIRVPSAPRCFGYGTAVPAS